MTTSSDLARRALLLAAATTLTGVSACAGGLFPQERNPLKVTLAGIEPESGRGLELRLLVKLRIQNPNDLAIDYNGLSFDLAVRNRDVASGVSAAKGRLERYGESIVLVPVTVHAAELLRQLWSLAGQEREALPYTVRGQVGGPFGPVRFETNGLFESPFRRG